MSKGVEGCQQLHSTDRVQHVRIVAWSGAKSAVLVQARQHKVQDVVAREGVRVSEQMQRSQSPVEAVQAQVLGEPVLELVFALGRVSAGLDGWLLARPRRSYALCRGSGCSGRAFGRRAAARRAWPPCLRDQGQRPETWWVGGGDGVVWW